MKKEEICKLIKDLNLCELKNYQKINTEQLCGELRDVMNFEWQIFPKKFMRLKKMNRTRLGNLCKNNM